MRKNFSVISSNEVDRLDNESIGDHSPGAIWNAFGYKSQMLQTKKPTPTTTNPIHKWKGQFKLISVICFCFFFLSFCSPSSMAQNVFVRHLCRCHCRRKTVWWCDFCLLLTTRLSVWQPVILSFWRLWSPIWKIQVFCTVFHNMMIDCFEWSTKTNNNKPLLYLLLSTSAVVAAVGWINMPVDLWWKRFSSSSWSTSSGVALSKHHFILLRGVQTKKNRSSEK